MTIDEAIEINGGLTQSVTAGIDEQEKEAIQLGIEALRRVGDCRQVICDFASELLPGETKD